MYDFNLITTYFPTITPTQIEQYKNLGILYPYWNERINLISRKDIEFLYEKHILHALAIAKLIQFKPQTQILDVGTGGGFPGIPLAIMFPEVQFHLIDIIGKKIKVVETISRELGLKNVKAEQLRAENIDVKYDFIISRAVTNMCDFVSWVASNIKKKNNHSLQNGILYLKGGNLEAELQAFPHAVCNPIKQWFDSPFFDTKQLVYLPL